MSREDDNVEDNGNEDEEDGCDEWVGEEVCEDPQYYCQTQSGKPLRENSKIGEEKRDSRPAISETFIVKPSGDLQSRFEEKYTDAANRSNENMTREKPYESTESHLSEEKESETYEQAGESEGDHSSRNDFVFIGCALLDDIDKDMEKRDSLDDHGAISTREDAAA